MEIQLLFYNKKYIVSKVKNFYTTNYRNFKKEHPTEIYTKKQLFSNIYNALSLNGSIASEISIHETTINEWKQNGWKEIKFLHWFFAVRLVIKLDGTIVGSIMDVLHESQHHNDNMQTKPYNESIIIKQSQLRRIIQESIKQYLNLQ